MNMPDWLDEVAPLFDPTALPRVVTLAVAQACGYPFHVVRRRVRRGAWQRLAPGVYCTAPPAGRLDRLAAAVAHGGPGAVISGTAAVVEYGLHVVAGADRVLVLVPTGAGARNYDWISVRRTRRLPEAAPRFGPALAPVARAVVDHARTLSQLDDVRAVVAEAVHRRLCAPAELWDEVELGSRNGRALVRQAVAEITDGARSAPEARAARALTAAGLGPFEQNAEILVDGRTYRPDFLWRALRAVLEIDSVEHHYRRRDWQATLKRHLVLETAGYSVVHVPPSALRDEADFVARIRDWLIGRAALLGRPASAG